MRPLSATECISPAFERARDFLARPFRVSTFLKLTAVAFFAELGGGFNFNYSRPTKLPGLPHGIVAAYLALVIGLGIVFFLIGLVFFYIGSRLQLVLVDMVATRQSYVAPSWRKYGSPVWRWIGLKLLYLLIAVVAMALLASPVLLYFVLHHQAIGTIFSHFTGLGIGLILLLVAAALLVLLVFSAAYLLLRDLALPSLALEDIGIGEMLRRLRRLVAAEPGSVALFLVLRIVLSFAMGIAGEILLAIALLISLIPFGLVGGALWLALHKAGAAGTAVLIVCGCIGGLIFLVWTFCLVIGVLGSVYVFGQAYSLYFLGGRYPLLGDLLERSTPPPPAYLYPPQYPPYPTMPILPPASEPLA